MTDRQDSRGATIRLTQLLHGTPAEVYSAWTTADSLKRWLCPGATIVKSADVDPRVGGQFKVVMQDEGVNYVHTGQYIELDPPRRLVFTWRSPATGRRDTRVTVELAPYRDKTRLTLTHEQLLDKHTAKKHESGWRSITDKLQTHLEDEGIDQHG